MVQEHGEQGHSLNICTVYTDVLQKWLDYFSFQMDQRPGWRNELGSWIT
jgi:hypothetical protein